jgi:hypothetical protein
VKKANSDWRLTEQLVATLEKFTSPDSKVEHNVLLSVIGRPERKPRQFDVVITTQINPHRKHIAVVEVQKRNSKPSLTTFHGWIKKMREVGAHQLICVSLRGFPKSIIDEVKNSFGESVISLMKLTEFDPLLNPQNINLDFELNVKNNNWKIEGMTTPQVEATAKKHQPQEIKKEEQVFMIGDSGKMNLRELCEYIVKLKSENKEIQEYLKTHDDYRIVVNFNEKNKLHIFIKGEKFEILKWTFSIIIKVTPITFESETRKFEYRQEIVNNAIAWIASTKIKFQNKIMQIDFILKMVEGEMKFTIEDKWVSP